MQNFSETIPDFAEKASWIEREYKVKMKMMIQGNLS
jgi:hypothetical protein